MNQENILIIKNILGFIRVKIGILKYSMKKIRDYILSAEGQYLLAQTGRRTWFGGVNKNANKDLFNPEWGIDTSKYIVPIKFPNTKIIQDALGLYQAELRKPVHTVFCLDYSGSMSGDGYKQLTSAMKYILNEESAKKDLIQFTEKDKITVIPFSTNVLNIWQVTDGTNTEELLKAENHRMELEKQLKQNK
mgnify:CR=1 FL=1